MNLFKKIWLENLKKNKEPLQRFVEDIGGIKGKFSWTKLDKNLNPIDKMCITNAVTINGRSSIVRLLAQGVSSKVGAINPLDYKISKMRFGNAKLDPISGVISADLDLHYYDLTEISRRVNSTDDSNALVVGTVRGAGGRSSNFLTTPSSNTRPSVSFNTIAANQVSNSGYTFRPNESIIRTITGAIEFPNVKVSTDTTPAREPSHKSLEVLLFDANNVLIEAIKFGGKYNKAIGGNRATDYGTGVIAGPEVTVSPYTTIVYPNIAINTKVLDLDNTILYYDVDKRWKLFLKAKAVADLNNPGNFAGHQVARYVVRFNIGQYNIIDSIVPVVGFNTGEGTNNVTRFANQPDSYSISNVAFSDGDNNSIDDYSVAFSVIMGANQGNGAGTGNDDRNVYYNEAFLFNERNELFSIVRMDADNGFIKNPDTAYLLTWQLSVDPN